jgi:protein TonB
VPAEASRAKLARPVTLAENAWDCPWPASADDHERDEARVELSVQVRPNGEAAAVRILHDPGLGFAEAARVCAARTTFEPARDERGQPITAWSPNIRVTFRR